MGARCGHPLLGCAPRTGVRWGRLRARDGSLSRSGSVAAAAPLRFTAPASPVARSAAPRVYPSWGHFASPGPPRRAPRRRRSRVSPGGGSAAGRSRGGWEARAAAALGAAPGVPPPPPAALRLIAADVGSIARGPGSAGHRPPPTALPPRGAGTERFSQRTRKFGYAVARRHPTTGPSRRRAPATRPASSTPRRSPRPSGGASDP